MKRFIIYMLFSLAIFTGCKKNNEHLIDGEKPEQRIIDALNDYSSKLTGSPYGWKAYLYPKGGGGYSFYMSFDAKNRVKMYADISDITATTSLESSYLLKANQIPGLLFDTYSYIHLLADPDASVLGGRNGWGLYSDFEFSFMEEKGDTLKLDGKLLKDTKLVMIKATQAEQAAYNAKGLFNNRSTSIKYFKDNPNLYVTLGDAIKVQTSFNFTSKVFSLIWSDNGTINTISSGFLFTLDGIVLQKPVMYKGKNITGFLWDPVKKLFYTTIDGKRVEVMVSGTPILPLYLLIGVNYNSVILPDATTYPGWSADFIARRAAANTATLNGGYNLRLGQMLFKFNTDDKTLDITIDIFQGTVRYVADFPYTYTQTANGIYKFTLGDLSGNAPLIVKEMAPLTTQRLNSDTFTLDYFVNPNTGTTLGQFKSVEHPDFTFSGALQ